MLSQEEGIRSQEENEAERLGFESYSNSLLDAWCKIEQCDES